MSTRTIPAKTEVICDRCSKVCEANQRMIGARLIYEGAALDFQGMPVANAGWSRDLCDDCWNEVGEAISKLVFSKP